MAVAACKVLMRGCLSNMICGDDIIACNIDLGLDGDHAFTLEWSLPICSLVLTSALESSATCTDNTHAFLINQAWVVLYDSYSICIAQTPACTTLGAGRPLLRPVSVWELMMSFIVHTFSCSKIPVGIPEEEENIGLRICACSTFHHQGGHKLMQCISLQVAAAEAFGSFGAADLPGAELCGEVAPVRLREGALRDAGDGYTTAQLVDARLQQLLPARLDDPGLHLIVLERKGLLCTQPDVILYCSTCCT